MKLSPAIRCLVFLGIMSCMSLTLLAQRQVTSLDGTWKIADSVAGDKIPEQFAHSVPVPGLANLAKPVFPQVDAFYSREQLANRIRSKLSPEEWLTNYWQGKVDQDRNYFWYQKKFHAPGPRSVALLKIAKAQFGTAVWLNGRKLGEYNGCFSASYFHLEKNIQWNQDNTLVIRIGAHPAVLPDNFPTGSDFEKIKWTPGIYDSVSVQYCDNPVIQSIQVAPRVAASEIIVQSIVENCGLETCEFDLKHKVVTWRDRRFAGELAPEHGTLKPGEIKKFTQTLKMDNARLWSPEDPFLYQLVSGTGGDSISTRFGMREFQFDGVTRRAYLNGKPYYLRGSNITLHRFFEDPLCKDLPWNEAWVRKLLVDIPKQMHWNYFRFCIGPVPDRWFEICDEAGLLIQNEFFVWTGGPGWYPGYSRSYDSQEMIRQYKDWMRDNWNHPSVAVWDANNETKNGEFASTIIPAVRPLDLSNRPWENSYNTPAGPNDPVEDHPYLMYSGYTGKLTFHMTDLEKMDGAPRPGSLPSDKHAPLINEYGWLWLNRDGSPTLLTKNVYAQLVGTNVTARERLDHYAYLLGAKTEFWRAHRHYAGIIHFVYLTCSYPGVYTSDHFADVTKLKLDRAFKDYLGEAFKPLGVYINFFQPTLPSGQDKTFKIMMVNDDKTSAKGDLKLRLETTLGKVLAETKQAFQIDALGQAVYEIKLTVPNFSGKCVLKAVAKNDLNKKTTLCRRWTAIKKTP